MPNRDSPEGRNEHVVIPRFTGRDLPPIGRLVIQFAPPMHIPPYRDRPFRLNVTVCSG